MDENKNKYSTLLIKTILIVFGVLSFILIFFMEAQKALLISGIVSLLFLVFMLSHLERNLRRSQFEINPSNKDPKKGLSWYEKEMENFLLDLSYELTGSNNGIKSFRPRMRQRIMGGEVEIERTPYLIIIKGPSGIVQILAKVVEIEL